MAKKQTIKEKRALFQKGKWGRKGSCFYCGVREVLTDLDHFYPKSKGGTNNVLIHCCIPCNREKADMTPSQYITYLRRHPDDRTRAISAVMGILAYVPKHIMMKEEDRVKEKAAANNHRRRLRLNWFLT